MVIIFVLLPHQPPKYPISMHFLSTIRHDNANYFVDARGGTDRSFRTAVVKAACSLHSNASTLLLLN